MGEFIADRSISRQNRSLIRKPLLEIFVRVLGISPVGGCPLIPLSRRKLKLLDNLMKFLYTPHR